MTDSSGAIVWAADYKPFGEATVSPSSTITNNLRFPGQYYDAETGLNYNYFRDYNPVIGRYVQADPIGIKGGWNLFGYADNNPIRNIDIWGLESNGCGPGDWRGKFVPDKPLIFVINFKSACDEHDTCYEKCGADKKQCDDDFKAAMKVLCFNKYDPNTVNVPMISFPNPFYNMCFNLAAGYHYAVSVHGGSAFKNAQDKNKDKCCKKK